MKVILNLRVNYIDTHLWKKVVFMVPEITNSDCPFNSEKEEGYQNTQKLKRRNPKEVLPTNTQKVEEVIVTELTSKKIPVSRKREFVEFLLQVNSIIRNMFNLSIQD